MRRDPRTFKIGVFAFFGILLLLVGIVTIGAGRYWLQEGRTVYCYFTESVSGVAVGSPLKLQGVEVGQVSDVVLLPPRKVRRLKRGVGSWDSVIEVKCTVYPEAIGAETGLVMSQDELSQWVGEQVSRGMRVSIKWKDITGQKYLSLDHYRISDHPIPDIEGTNTPYIPTAVEASFSDIQRDLATTLSKLASVDFEQMSRRVLDVLDLVALRVEALDTQSLQGHAEETLLAVRELAEDPALRRLIDRLDEISGSMTTSTKRVEELLANGQIDSGIEDFGAAAASIRRTVEGLERDIPQLMDKVDQIAVRAEEQVVAADVSGTTASIQNAADKFGGAADKVGAAMRDVSAMREEMRRLMRSVSDTSKSLARLARSLEEQPGSLLAGKRVSGEASE